MWNLGDFSVELRDFWAEKEWPFCVELRGDVELRVPLLDPKTFGIFSVGPTKIPN